MLRAKGVERSAESLTFARTWAIHSHTVRYEVRLRVSSRMVSILALEEGYKNWTWQIDDFLIANSTVFPLFYSYLAAFDSLIFGLTA
jgi:hypothetical protein